MTRTLTILAALVCIGAAQSDAPRNDLPQPYRTTRDWGELPPGVKWAAVTAIEPAPDGSIYVIHRCFANSCANRSEAPILKYDANGKLLASWGSKMFIFPHGATVDRDGSLWVTDARGQRVWRVLPGGRIAQAVDTGDRRSFACMLGGPDRRTLVVITNTGSGPKMAEKSDGRIETIRVDVPGAGLP